MKKFLIAGNWKMNKTTAEAVEFAEALKNKELKNAEDCAIMAPFTQLVELKKALEGTGVKIGAQNVHFEPSGAYTGEISVPMLKEIGVDYCVVGHSERRQYFNETDNTCNLKIKALLENGIKPILCVGESLEIREAKGEQTFVASQLFEDLEGIYKQELENIVIAYEPIWAIGTGHTATPDQAEEMCAFIKGIVSGMYEDPAVGDELIVLYGGSMKAANAYDLLAKPDINGGLIGGDSLKVDNFSTIAEAAASLQ